MQEHTLNQEEIDDFLKALASALLAWQGVEHNLFLIFNILAGPHKTPAVLSAIYYTSVTLKPQLAMVDAVANVVLDNNPYLEEWKKLSKNISEKAEKRNCLAHFGLVMHSSKGKTIALLKPSIFNVKAKHDRDYDIKSIDAWRESFISLASEISMFLDNLPSKLNAVRPNTRAL
ncbi:MAG: hypothetical protein HY016_06270 [Nitrosomonadales bacterium]|nr:hypothetical protein [Nitrosomonadales bacterium]